MVLCLLYLPPLVFNPVKSGGICACPAGQSIRLDVLVLAIAVSVGFLGSTSYKVW